MAAQAVATKKGQVLVNKQFNSPIKLYSPENVADVLNKQTQVLENGAVGIDFHQLSAPGHLANSAVLRMLAEEERQRGGALKEDSPPPLTPAAEGPDAPGPKTVVAIPEDISREDGKVQQGNPRLAWRPKEYGIGLGYNNVTLKHPLFSSSRFPISQGLKRVAWPPPPDSEGAYIESQPVFSKGSETEAIFSPPATRQALPAWQPPSPSPASAAGPVPAPNLSPLVAAAAVSAPAFPPPAISPKATAFSPLAASVPAPFSPATASPGFAPVQAPRPKAPVQAPASPAPAPQFQGSPLGQPGQPQYPPPLQPYQYPSYQAPAFEPPPSTVVLRPEPPINQAPFPVFESQPAATRAAEPKMRGDEKWPPTEYKARAAAENEQRKALARGPAVRPRKVNRDYSRFFAQHALTSTYPGYKAPPGTQHYVEEGTSNF